MRTRQIVRCEGMLFQRDEMQFRAPLRIVQPGRPGGEEVDTEAEAGLRMTNRLARCQRSGKLLPAMKRSSPA